LRGCILRRSWRAAYENSLTGTGNSRRCTWKRLLPRSVTSTTFNFVPGYRSTWQSTRTSQPRQHQISRAPARQRNRTLAPARRRGSADDKAVPPDASPASYLSDVRHVARARAAMPGRGRGALCRHRQVKRRGQHCGETAPLPRTPRPGKSSRAGYRRPVRLQ